MTPYQTSQKSRMMNHLSLPARKLRPQWPMPLLALLLAALAGVAPAQTPPAAQIPLTEAQIQRAGIATMPALAASEAPAGDGGTQLSGTVVAPPSALAIVSTAVGGIVQQVMVSTLQQVERDTPVAVLYSQQLAETQRDYLNLSIQARLAQEKLARDERLLNEGIISTARMQETRGAAMQAGLAAKERYQALRAAGMSERAIKAMAAGSRLAPQLTVTAGARGTVTALDIHAGQRIDAGMPIAQVSTGAALWIELQATREQAARIRVGDLLQVKDCGAAKVIAIAPQVSAANQSTVIRAQLQMPGDCLKPNQFVEASLGTARIAPDSVGVPAAAVIRSGAATYVFVRSPQGFEAVKVGVQATNADRAWVKGVPGKLAAGSPVAVRGLVALKGSWTGLGPEQAAPDAKAGGAK